MIKHKSKSTLNKPIEMPVNFSFSTSKSKITQEINSILTSAERRALGMWLQTVLQFHSDDFLRAMKKSRKFSVIRISNYLSKYYPHLKTIVQYYIIAVMVDYELIISEKQEVKSLQKQCLFINLIIEELTSRFFRESQWLHKISHILVYKIFSLFDEYCKGYTTLSELRKLHKKLLSSNILVKTNVVLREQKISRKKEKLLSLKLNNNIQGTDCKIYQENIEQLMFRVNLVNFDQKSGLNSKRYQTIKQIVEQHQQIMTERYEKECQQIMIREIKEKQEIQLMKQNYQIKYKSNIMSKSKDQNENKNQMNKGEYSYKVPQSIFSTMPHYNSNLTSQRQNIDYCLKDKNRQFRKNQRLNYQSAIRARVQRDNLEYLMKTEEEIKSNIIVRQNQFHKKFVEQNTQEIERNKKALQFRNTVLQQLQFIREQKKSNRFRLFSYI